MAASDPYAFREMTVDDLPMIARWLATPEVVEWWGEPEEQHALVAGDLNAPGEVEVLREFRAVDLRDPGGGPTNPSIAPAQRLDYVLIPDHARLVEQSQPDGGDWWWALSDHIPVLVAFEA